MKTQKTYLETIAEPCKYFILLLTFDTQTTHNINVLQHELMAFFDKPTVYRPTSTQLHCTLMHIISPTTETDDAEGLFQSLQQKVDKAMESIADACAPFEISFGSIQSYVDAGVVILEGHDDGSMQAIRSAASKTIPLPKGTRTPPDIIHTSILRFKTCKDEKGLQEYIASKKLEPTVFRVSKITLVRETRIFTQAYDILVEYNLKGNKRII